MYQCIYLFNRNSVFEDKDEDEDGDEDEDVANEGVPADEPAPVANAVVVDAPNNAP